MNLFSFLPEDLLVFRRKRFETFSISLDEDVDPQTPIGSFFSEPIQVGILKLTSERVKLCVHAHEAFDISLDGFVDDALIAHYKDEYV